MTVRYHVEGEVKNGWTVLAALENMVEFKKIRALFGELALRVVDVATGRVVLAMSAP